MLTVGELFPSYSIQAVLNNDKTNAFKVVTGFAQRATFNLA